MKYIPGNNKVRFDKLAQDVYLNDYEANATELGQLGTAVLKQSVDANTLVKRGLYYCETIDHDLNYPIRGTVYIKVDQYGNTIHQFCYTLSRDRTWYRWNQNNGASWTGWTPERFNALTPYPVSIFISKDGNDLNDGVTSLTPVLTINRAREIARGVNIGHDIYFLFGPGDWGNIEIFATEFQCNCVLVGNFSNSNVTTKAEFDALTDVPHFNSIAFRDGNIYIRNINADLINLTNCWVNNTTYFKMYRMQLSALSRVYIGNPFTIKHVSGGTHAVFENHESVLTLGNTTCTFESGCEQSCFIYAPYGQGVLDVNSSFTSSGTFAGKKFIFNNVAYATGMNPTSYPGSQDGTGAYFHGNKV